MRLRMVLLAINLSLLFVYLVSAALLLKYKNHRMIRARGSYRLAVQIAAVIMHLCWYVFCILLDVFQSGRWCWVTPWTLHVTLGVVMTVYLVRGWCVLFQFALAYQGQLYNRLVLQGDRARHLRNEQLYSSHRLSLPNYNHNGGHSGLENVKDAKSENVEKVDDLSPETEKIPNPDDFIMQSWFVRHRHLGDGPFMRIFGPLVVLLGCCFGLIQMCAKCDLILCVLVLNCHLSTMFALVLTLGFLSARYGRDAFEIKREYSCLLLGFLVGLIVTVIAFLGTQRNSVWQYLLVFLVRIWYELSVLGCSFLYPLWLARCEFMGTRKNSLKDLRSFEALLNDEKFFNAFVEYLQTEFSAENIFFWREVNQFRANMVLGQAPMGERRATALREAVRIFNMHVSEHANFQVNVSSQRRNLCQAQLTAILQTEAAERAKQMERRSLARKAENGGEDRDVAAVAFTCGGARVNPEGTDKEGETEETSLYFSTFPPGLAQLFDEAQREVMSLMRRDSFPRFLKSHQFAALSTVEHVEVLLGSCNNNKNNNNNNNNNRESGGGISASASASASAHGVGPPDSNSNTARPTTTDRRASTDRRSYGSWFSSRPASGSLPQTASNGARSQRSPSAPFKSLPTTPREDHLDGGAKPTLELNSSPKKEGVEI